MDNAVKGSDVQSILFKTSIERLKTINAKDGKVTIDPLTKAVLESLNASRKDFDKLSEQDKNNLIVLTDKQRQSVKNLDKELREAYLNKKVEIHDDKVAKDPI